MIGKLCNLKLMSYQSFILFQKLHKLQCIKNIITFFSTYKLWGKDCYLRYLSTQTVRRNKKTFFRNQPDMDENISHSFLIFKFLAKICLDWTLNINKLVSLTLSFVTFHNCSWMNFKHETVLGNSTFFFSKSQKIWSK